MTKEGLRFASVLIATTVLFFGGGNPNVKISEDKIPQSNPNQVHIIPVPCEQPMPWNPSFKKAGQSENIEIVLVSLKGATPTENPIGSECWIVEPNEPTSDAILIPLTPLPSQLPSSQS